MQATQPSTTPELPTPDQSRTQSHVRFVVAVVLAAAALVYIAFTSFQAEVYFFTVAEARAQSEAIGDQEFRVKGDVVAGSHYMRDGTLDRHRFELVSDGATLEVYFTGALPDTFSDDAEVVALGRLVSESRFEAVEVVAKCPSRYEETVPTASAR